MLLCLWGIWVNGIELVERGLDHDTYFSQMENLTVRQSVTYSIAYLLPFMALLFFGIRSTRRGKKMYSILFFGLIWLVMYAELYSDFLFRYKV
ncbi:MAG TPA: hypothetical protein VGO45_08605 [Bacteroidia bacterium]|jgi:predicted aspartyl protease|nr:hypothetical protein [Bacteroidia bacterium]